MRRILTIPMLLVLVLSGCSSVQEVQTDDRIIHTVVFTLKHEKGSAEAQEFLEKARQALIPIPQVTDFEVRSQISSKSGFQYGFSMKFTDQQAYDAYNNHPSHVDFVQNVWEKEVADFQELDFLLID